MKPEKIYIERGIPLDEWMDKNKHIILNSIYNNIFDFLESDEDLRIVLKVTTKLTSELLDTIHPMDGLTFDFMLIRSDIDNTIDALIRNYEEIEDYEKCSKLINLKKMKFELFSSKHTCNRSLDR
jgi:hypothetical protein